MRKPLFISSVLGANILEVAACGRENADGSGISAGGEDSADCVVLDGPEADVGVCVMGTEDEASPNNLLVTEWGRVFEENVGSFLSQVELAERESEAGDGVEVGEGEGAGTLRGVGGAWAKILVVTTCGCDAMAGKTTGFTSVSTSGSPDVS
jgi:hypothetical protein